MLQGADTRRKKALMQDDGRAVRVAAFEVRMLALTDFAVVKLDRSNGVILATRRA